MNGADRVLWFLSFLLSIGALAVVASVATELRRLRRQRERHDTLVMERHEEELEHLVGIRVAIASHGARIGQALVTAAEAAEAARDTPVMAQADEIPPPPPLPDLDLRVSLPAPPGTTEDADPTTSEDEIGTSTFDRASMPLPKLDRRCDEGHGNP